MAGELINTTGLKTYAPVRIIGDCREAPSMELPPGLPDVTPPMCVYDAKEIHRHFTAHLQDSFGTLVFENFALIHGKVDEADVLGGSVYSEYSTHFKTTSMCLVVRLRT